MDARGNARVNEEYEWHGVSGCWKPVADEGRAYRERFVRSKYRDRAFTRRGPEGGEGGGPSNDVAQHRDSIAVVG